MDQFEAYFRRADLDQDGRISGAEAVAFFQASNLPKPLLAQIWTYVDQSHTGFLSRQEFFNYLKLVTVAQKRELTPEIVKAALYTPASAKIPPPQINLAAIPGPRPANNVGSAVPSVSGAAVPPVSGAAPITAPSIGVRGQQGFPAQQSQYVRPPRPPIPSSTFQSQPGVSGQGMAGAGTMAGFSPANSSGWLAGNGGSQAAVTSQAPNVGISSRSQDGFHHASPQQNQKKTTYSALPGSSKLNDATLRGNQPDAKDSKAVPVSGNGFASDSPFGDAFSVASVQPKQNSAPSISSASSLPVSPSIINASAGLQHPVKAHSVNPRVALPQQPVNQHQQAQLTGRPNQQVLVPSSAANPNAAGNSLSGQSQLPWPRMTRSDYQKYSKVFMAVDTDRDGKITGQEARNLFLSWKLPREVLKQVWDLSDQDNDSMLSLREFCIALYLMERHREGRPLPSVLPTNLIFDEPLLPASGQPTPSHGAVAWRHTPASQQTQGPRGAGQVASGAPGKPPRPVPIFQPNEVVQPSQQKPKVPALEKHLVDQLSQEEQDALNSKFQEATDAEKKVMELEKEILDAKEKIQFYHAKMQELILYKSRCDNRLNEITQRTSADKREVELLAKKYEEKYKQTGDVASKLTIEEATFRDIQEKKMELYKEIVKMDQDGKTDGIQDRASHIQMNLEELVKALNERCKTYGLRAKPTTLLELPFGWQPGIQEGAADWDEEWDKFEDEGFTFVKELTLDVKNVIAPPKPKSSLVREKASPLDEDAGQPSADADTEAKVDKVPNHGQAREVSDTESAHGHQQTARSPTDSPSRSNAVESPSKEFQESMYGKDVNFDGSPHAAPRKDIGFDGSPHAAQSERWGTESVFSDKGFDESGWGTFDTNFDTDAAWDLNSVAKDADRDNHKEASLFGADDWGLSPIKTGSKQSIDTLPKQSPFFDSVPSTPSYNAGLDNTFPKQSPFFDSVPSTPSYNAGFSYSDNTFPKQSPFFDSVPSTPNYNSGFSQTDMFSRQSPFFDSVPGTPAYNSGGSPNADNMFQKKSPFAFGDSVPSTPMYSSTNSPRRSSEGFEEHSNSFSRFDSFNMQDSGPFGTRDSLSRFDSMRSTRDSDYDHGSFQQRDSFARFDSFRSTADSDYNFGQFPPRASLTRFDSISSTRDTDHGHGFPSLDDADPFGSNDPFKTSVESQAPRRDSDSWKAF
ncbi:PREDICTED: actin cytoskeleton-regulatory complex protein pan1-like [Nicotiana attenuata]|uniref:Eh domain-containing protein 2 n=1 Tax=Nicotiana attenuata TaxID=49451 RepID=A0A1J6J932_NICAT|nr:PREDICTED: actin cytoskeleton-regulatory complex protein pan1-like [Nicotiana attenuata]OIT06327.1 hypothetical protein A4A49_30107 [Nicotiana attenuata]